MDLSKVVRKETISVEIKTPNGEKTDIIINMFSPGTKEFKQVDNLIIQNWV